MAVATEKEYGLLVGGESVEPAAGEVRELAEPATGEPLARTAIAGGADVDRAVDAARAALTELESRNVGKAISAVENTGVKPINPFGL